MQDLLRFYYSRGGLAMSLTPAFPWQSFGISPPCPCQRQPCALVSAGTLVMSSLPQLSSLHCLWAAWAHLSLHFPKGRLLKSPPEFKFRVMEVCSYTSFQISLEHFISNMNNIALAHFSLQQPGTKVGVLISECLEQQHILYTCSPTAPTLESLRCLTLHSILSPT